MLLINTGNDFRSGAEPEKRRAEVMFKSFSLMKVDCLALSEKEFAFGVDFLRRQAAEFSLPLVCANLKDKNVKSAYFVPFLRWQRAGRNILVTAVVDPAKTAFFRSRGLEVSDPVTAVRRLQKNISHDLLIVVMQTNKATAAKWLSRLSGVDLVFLGQEKGVQTREEKIHGARVLYSCDRGKYVSAVEVAFAAGKKYTVKTPENFLLRAGDFKEDAQVAALVSEFETWLHGYYSRQQKNFTAVKDRKGKPRGGLPAVFQQLIKKNKRSRSSSYVGAARCGECHREKFARWKKSRHARALATLKAKRRENDPNCYRCHVTGIVATPSKAAADNPFARLLAAAHLPDVQCEACHGAGAAHAANQKDYHLFIPREQDCRRCHTHDTDPEFSFARKKKLICR